MARLIGSTTGFQVDRYGRRVHRLHTHACGHGDRCALEHFAATTAREDCRRQPKEAS